MRTPDARLGSLPAKGQLRVIFALGSKLLYFLERGRRNRAASGNSQTLSETCTRLSWLARRVHGVGRAVLSVARNDEHRLREQLAFASQVPSVAQRRSGLARLSFLLLGLTFCRLDTELLVDVALASRRARAPKYRSRRRVTYIDL